MTRRSPIALAAGVALLVVPLLAAPVGAANGVRTQHDRTVAYWTAERIRGAIPRDFIRTSSGRFVPAAKPPGTGGGKPGGGGGGGTVGGASWTGGGEIVERSGRVLFTMGGTNYICSASVADDGQDAAYSVILTAAHCAYDEVAGAFATNWMYIPSFDTAPTYSCASTTFGCWTALALVVHNGYATAGGFNEQATVHDYAFAVVGAGGKSGGPSQVDTLGAYPVVTNAANGDTLWAFGYPAAGKYKGKDLTYCKGPIFPDPYNANKTWGMTCNMTGGSSGGPWLAGTDIDPAKGTGGGYGSLGSLNSYGYSGINAMHGPKFDSRTNAVYNAARNATPDAMGIDGIIVQ